MKQVVHPTRLVHRKCAKYSSGQVGKALVVAVVGVISSGSGEMMILGDPSASESIMEDVISDEGICVRFGRVGRPESGTSSVCRLRRCPVVGDVVTLLNSGEELISVLTGVVFDRDGRAGDTLRLLARSPSVTRDE